jgi:tetratricopeptide (TPR) repeat protein
MFMRTNMIEIVALVVIVITSACTKDFLDKKPNKSSIVPSKLADYRALLDNPNVMMFNSTPAMGLLSADDFTIPDNLVKTLPANERGAYLWEREMPASSADWFFPYAQVLYTNVTLDGLPLLTNEEKQSVEYRYINGTALFLRAFAFYNLLEAFTKPYNPTTAQIDPGIPIRLNSDPNLKVGRGNIKQGYDQVIVDLKTATELLPATDQYKSRPTKAAAFALLARIHLIMGRFTEAGNYATESLKLSGSLIDYKTLNKTALRPFPLALPNGNAEVLFYGTLTSTVFSSSALTSVSSECYGMYPSGDLRKDLFFDNKGNGIINFKGSYSGDTYFFSGLAADEQYLVRAECYARAENIEKAMADLNTLLAKRWDASFVPLTAHTTEEALVLVLKERRKELIGRGLRLSDLRRLNQVPKLAVTLMRTFDGKNYTLPPEDGRYAFPIPDQEISLTGIAQNLR